MSRPRRSRGTLRAAEPPGSPPARLSACRRQEILDRVAARVERGEVDPDRLAAYLDEETDAEGPENP